MGVAIGRPSFILMIAGTLGVSEVRAFVVSVGVDFGDQEEKVKYLIFCEECEKQKEDQKEAETPEQPFEFF